MQSQKLVIITTIAVLLLVISAVSTVTPYNVFAKSNIQTSSANNDCPADVFSFFVGVQQQASANCLNDINSVQDSDGASIASTPFNAAPSQGLDLELEFGDENGDTAPPPPETGILNVFKIVECTDLARANIPDMCDPSWYHMFFAFGINPNPGSFLGSSKGTPVSLEPGEYSVGEEVPRLEGSLWVYDESPDCHGLIEAGQEITCTFTNYVDYEPQSCLECFTTFLDDEQIMVVERFIAAPTIEDYCEYLEESPPELQMEFLGDLADFLAEPPPGDPGPNPTPIADDTTIENLINCLERVLGLQTESEPIES